MSTVRALEWLFHSVCLSVVCIHSGALGGIVYYTLGVGVVDRPGEWKWYMVNPCAPWVAKLA